MSPNKNKKFFEKELETILFIFLEAKDFYQDYKYIFNPDTEEERQASNNSFVRKISKAFWRITVINLAKLFQKSKTQHYNLIDYITDLEANYEKYDWIGDFPKIKLKEWLDLLLSNEINEIISKLKIQRNQYYAHTDKNPSKPIIESLISPEEIDKLILLTEEIIFSLNNVCLRTHLEFDIPGTEKAGHILEMIYTANKKRNDDLIDKFNREMNNRNLD